MPHPGRLDGRTCVIVGGTSGIGLHSAHRFLQEGASVVISGLAPVADRTRFEDLARIGPVFETTAEVGEVASIEALFEFSRDQLGGRIDIVLHVAGMSGRAAGDGPLELCTDQAWDLVMRTNSRGVFFTNRAAIRLMLVQTPDDQGMRGAVVNVGSVLARSPAPAHFDTIAYAASKGAVAALTLAAASRYAPDRIRFNLIEPGLIDTPMAARALARPEIRGFLAAKQPLTGGPGLPIDVAEAALFLCEPAARFITGVTLTVDGGWSISDGLMTRYNTK